MTDELRVVKGAAARLRDGNPEPRVPCVLLLDVSSSMSGDKIHELNEFLLARVHHLLRGGGGSAGAADPGWFPAPLAESDREAGSARGSFPGGRGPTGMRVDEAGDLSSRSTGGTGEIDETTLAM